MNLALKALLVLLCSAGSASATTQSSTAARVAGVANPELCYLDGAAKAAGCDGSPANLQTQIAIWRSFKDKKSQNTAPVLDCV